MNIYKLKAARILRSKTFWAWEIWCSFEFMWGGKNCSYWFEASVGPLTLTAHRRMMQEEIERR